MNKGYNGVKEFRSEIEHLFYMQKVTGSILGILNLKKKSNSKGCEKTDLAVRTKNIELEGHVFSYKTISFEHSNLRYSCHSLAAL